MEKKKTYNNTLSEKTKIADMISTYPNLLLLLPRFGVKLGFGECNISDVCHKHDISPSFFILVCRAYTEPDFQPSKADIKSVSMKDMMTYLKSSHRYYTNMRLPHIERHLTSVIKACEPKLGKMLKNFFDEYKQEIAKHFEYEEKTVFPYIESLLSGKSTKGYSIAQFKDNHSNIEDKLTDLLNILLKYLPSDIDEDNRIDLSLHIIELSADLNSHSVVEERILMPFVENIESKKP